MDIAGAYPPEAGVRSWERTFLLARGNGAIIEDRYELASEPSELFFSLVTPCAVEIEDGRLVLGSRELPDDRCTGAGEILFDARRLAATCEPVEIDDAKLAGTWGPRLFRVVLQLRALDRQGVVRMEVRSGA
jgi:hypothetical protein